MRNEDIFNKFYEEKDKDDKPFYPIYHSFDLNKPIKPKTADRYINYFLDLYANQPADVINIHGYSFPINPFLKLLSDPAIFGKTKKIRLSWGLISYKKPWNLLGNFRILIQAADTTENGYVIEFRTERIEPNDNECPPRVPCNPPQPS